MKGLKKHVALLGLKVRDKVTGFEGVVSSVSFDLYGCVQAVVAPPVKEDGTLPQGSWFDIARLKVLDLTPVVQLPDFNSGYVAEGLKGPAEKPAR